MSRDDIREALLLLEEPAEASPEFRQALLQRFIGEATAEERVEAAERPAPSRRRRPRWLRLKLVPAVAAVVIIALLGALFLVVPRTKSAWAALERAQDQFQRRPLHATISNSTQAFDADLNTVMEIEVVEHWFESETRWRSTVLSNNLFPHSAGNFVVLNGERSGSFSAEENTFNVRPASEMDDPYLQSGLAIYNPTQGNWGTNTGIKPTRQFLDENCSLSEGRIADRPAEKLTCKTGLGGDTLHEATIWLDRETGFILKLDTFSCGTVEGERRCGHEAVREVKSIDFDPTFPEGIFEVSAPEGATVSGESAEPSASAPEADAVIPVEGVVSDIVVGLGAVWVMEWNRSDIIPPARQPGSPPPSETASTTTLKRIDPKTNSVVATVPAGSFPGSLAVQGGYLWIATTDERGEPSSLRRLDPKTNEFIGAPFPLENEHAQLAASVDALWATYSGHSTLDRIDPTSGRVTVKIPLQGSAYGRPVYGANSIWVYTQEENPRDNYINRIHRIDVATKRVVATIPGKGDLSFGEGALWTLCCATGSERSITLSRIDPASNAVTSTELPTGANALAAGAGYIWITDGDDGTLTKVDPFTLKIVGSPIGVGRDPWKLAVGAGAVWVGTYEGGTVTRINLKR